MGKSQSTIFALKKRDLSVNIEPFEIPAGICTTLQRLQFDLLITKRICEADLAAWIGNAGRIQSGKFVGNAFQGNDSSNINQWIADRGTGTDSSTMMGWV